MSNTCDYCRSDAKRLTQEEAEHELKSLNGWSLIDENPEKLMLQRQFPFPDFASALHFTNQVGEFAEQVGHHPDLYTAWGNVTVVWYTHKIKGVQVGDFLCAKETDRIYSQG
ncbi:4a-hydroxytetrahydrobiopterin dehydratase [Nitrincola nitratireducens]|uniref:Putative pterin-4-alpha-carbinolamine dehydratase n=1 Tax=Nitrincola nitratireducens TaxID=1229521 RepID=W9VJZ8_9GAMM|nr:4a-hydroxytetrahydrobiopterin dehydratase [Nitrincola nitratireducens]EXJ10880.1 Putative pterin-4-alpha-carbinolamine dehydratase [Nitrincola nitratireducens]